MSEKGNGADTVDRSLQEKLRRAKIARQQFINAERRFERTNLPIDFERIDKKRKARDEADAEIKPHKLNGRIQQPSMPNENDASVDSRFAARWRELQGLRVRWHAAMRRFMRDGTDKQLEKLQEIQAEIHGIEGEE